ncbi:MAG TPA: hypothetical protein VGG33_11730 [Polyangia bacterium]
MEFGAFERLVLRFVLESPEALTSAHIAYLSGMSVERAERYLGRMVEAGTLTPQLGTDDVVEYVFAGRRSRALDQAMQASRLLGRWEAVPSSSSGLFDRDAREGNGDADEASEEGANAATAVLLSVLVPGAGHIYAGRSSAGVAWMATTLVGYACCLLPGLFLHGLCMVSAAHTRTTA